MKKKAFVACNGGCYNHDCTYGCIACGLCVAACPSGAISITEQGVALVDREKCTGCGMCEASCPQGIISLHDEQNYILVRCSNHVKGGEAKKQCDKSCMGCGLCNRNCPTGAIRITDFCARIEDDLCLSCGMCAVKCQRSAITDLRGILTDL